MPSSSQTTKKAVLFLASTHHECVTKSSCTNFRNVGKKGLFLNSSVGQEDAFSVLRTNTDLFK